MGWPLGRWIGWITSLISVAIGIAAGIHTGAVAASILAYAIFVWSLLSQITHRIPTDATWATSFLPRDRLVANNYRFFLQYPGAATALATAMNILKFTLLIWGILCFSKVDYVVGGVSVAYFLLTPILIAKLDPLTWLTPKAKKGNDFCKAEVESLARIMKRKNMNLTPE